MYSINEIKKFYKDKKVLVTGCAGFKASWLNLWLESMGAKVIGIDNTYGHEKGLFQLTKQYETLYAYNNVDITNYEDLSLIFRMYNPEIVFHLAAQPIVRKSYDIPRQTFETNTMGSINVMDCVRNTNSVKSVVMITTDKVYKNKEWLWGYRETDELGGNDPYSASKSCAELAIKSYYESFFKNSEVAIASVRAGNVIGGGDWAEDRIMTDIINSFEQNQTLQIRNPYSTRPFQHVLEPLRGYLMTGMLLYHKEYEFNCFNFGPDRSHIVTVKELVETIGKSLGNLTYNLNLTQSNKKECKYLSLDSTKADRLLGWQPKLTFNETINLVTEWYTQYQNNNVLILTLKQIGDYEYIL